MGEIFRPDVLQYFRRYWEMVQLPSLEYLKKNGLYQKYIFTNDVVRGGMGFSPIVGYKEPAYIFFDIDATNFFIEHWTTFAGLWFEDIEPLFGTGIVSGNIFGQ
jgi:hypothetical protein